MTACWRNVRTPRWSVSFHNNQVNTMHLQSLGSATVQVRPRLRSADEIAERLAEAVRTLAAIPNVGCKPAGFGNSWRMTFETYSWASFAEGVMDPAAITRMDEALSWPSLLPADRARERKILLLRAAGCFWSSIGREVGMSHEGARRAHGVAVRLIVAALNEPRPLETQL